MPLHLDDSNEVVVQLSGSPLTRRSSIKFTGDTPPTVTDNPGNDSTDVVPAGGGSGGGYIGYMRWLASPVTVGPLSGNYLDTGTLDESGGSTTWYDGSYSDPSTSLFYFAEAGLYRYTVNATFTRSATQSQSERLGLRVQVFPGLQIVSNEPFYDAYKGFQVVRSHATDASTTWGVSVSITDYFGPSGTPGQSGIINTRVEKNGGITDRDVYVETWISRIL